MTAAVMGSASIGTVSIGSGGLMGVLGLGVGTAPRSGVRRRRALDQEAVPGWRIAWGAAAHRVVLLAWAAVWVMVSLGATGMGGMAAVWSVVVAVAVGGAAAAVCLMPGPGGWLLSTLGLAMSLVFPPPVVMALCVPAMLLGLSSPVTGPVLRNLF